MIYKNLAKALVSLAAVSATADALTLGKNWPFGKDGNQIVFDADSGTESSDSAFYGQASDLLDKLSKSAGDSLGKVSSEAVNAWAHLLQYYPESIADLKLPNFLTGNQRKVVKQADDEWVHIVQSTDFPAHVLKVKTPTDLGVDDTKQYSGYLNVNEGEKNLFYWFFESRNDPKTDPIVLWLNGGPGCSSLTGLFFELGPASIDETIKPVHNPYSWNNNASIIFLDQPVNTGYSYSDTSVSDTVTAGKDVYAFLSLFFKQFPEYTDLKFHIAGESYGGHYIPVFADEILSHADRNFNLSSVLIGNGLTDPRRQYDQYQPMGCGEGGAPPVLDESTCQAMLNAQPRCNSLIDSCYSTQSVWLCVPAAIQCNNAMLGPYQQTGRNVYDVREDCEGGNLCYPALDLVEQYLNKEEVKKAVGAEVDKYEGCNMNVNSNFMFAGDWMKPYYTHVTNLLESGLPVLIYAGDKDFICNWLGNQAWSDALEWSGSKGYSKAKKHDWTVDGEKAGVIKSFENFSFLRVFEAGHMVPYNQPENALAMFNTWLSGDLDFSSLE